MDVSFQLYSARNFMPWEHVFETLSAVGYTQVEGFGGVYQDAQATRAGLDAHGLTMPSGHVGLEDLEGDLEAVVRTAESLGMGRIFCPFLAPEDRPSDRQGWEAIAARLSPIGSALAGRGLSFGWHNHDFEFMALPDGAIPMEVLLDAAPGIGWEADIAWIERGGADPLRWIARFGDRITAAHVKDIAPSGTCVDEDGWADVGQGIMDWEALMAALRATDCGLFIVEHDNPSDIDRFARRSFSHLTRLWGTDT